MFIYDIYVYFEIRNYHTTIIEPSRTDLTKILDEKRYLEEITEIFNNIIKVCS